MQIVPAWCCVYGQFMWICQDFSSEQTFLSNAIMNVAVIYDTIKAK